MAVKIGNLDISAFKVGSADTKVYLGDTLLYPTAPPSFQGKWLATYTGGTTSSAECDASSAITYNEITKSNLVSVEIGDCVTSIGEQAFIRYSGLTSIVILDSVTSIGSGAFQYCYGLTKLNSDVDGVFNIPSGVTSIGNNAFLSCRSLTSIVIPDSVTSIGVGAFEYCYGLTSCTIGSGVTSIGQYAFYQCSGLTTCTIGSGVTSIGNSTFSECTSLTSITIEATTPPTLGNTVFGSTNNYPIYVPSQSVNAYKTASGWSDYASRIHAIPIIPTAYTQVEYVENQNMACINTEFKPNQDTRIIAEMQTVASTSYVNHFGAGGWNEPNALILDYENNYNGTLHLTWGTASGWTVVSSVRGDYSKHTYDWNKNEVYRDNTLVKAFTYGNYQAVSNLYIFCTINNGSSTPSPTQNYYMKGKLYSLKIYDNGTLVRDFIPCIRDNDNKVGVYDIVNNQFYSSASGYELVAGNPI